MTPRTVFIAILATTLLNGFVSPVVPFVFLMSPVWLPEFAPHDHIAVLYGTSLIVSLSTLIVSGVPAGLFELVTGREETDMSSMLIWLATGGLLTLPGVT